MRQIQAASRQGRCSTRRALPLTLLALAASACGGGGGSGAAATTPGAPVIGTATPGDGQVVVAFAAPASDGGSPILDYTATCGARTATGPASPLIVTGLTNGTPTTATVTARNAIGTGPASAPSGSVTPAALPGAPIIGTARAGNGQAIVAFTAPLSDGGAPILSYMATCGAFTATGPASPLTVTGPANGTTYTCTVRATNAAGTGPASAASNAITPSPDADTWATKTLMPTPRWSPAVGEIGGVIYAAGGYNGSHLATVEAYSIAGNSWVAKAARPSLQTSPAVAVVGGLLYTFGGTNCCVNISTTTAYDPTPDGWTPKSPLALGVRSQAAAGVVGGVVYVVGGHDNSGAVAFNEAYNPVTDTWATKAGMPSARTSLGVGVIDGVVYAVGGNVSGVHLGVLEAYDPVTDSWTTRAPMPTPRSDLVVGVINGLLYAAGGTNGSNLATVEAYNPGTNTWSTVASMPTARTDAQGTAVGGRLFVIGGFNGVNTPLGTVEVYTP